MWTTIWHWVPEFITALKLIRACLRFGRQWRFNRLSSRSTYRRATPEKTNRAIVNHRRRHRNRPSRRASTRRK